MYNFKSIRNSGMDAQHIKNRSQQIPPDQFSNFAPISLKNESASRCTLPVLQAKRTRGSLIIQDSLRAHIHMMMMMMIMGAMMTMMMIGEYKAAVQPRDLMLN